MHHRLALALAAASVVTLIAPPIASAQRSLGLDVSAWQGNISQTTWNNIHNVENRSFVFIRSSRGGTTGEDHRQGGYSAGNNTQYSLSQRYDDPYFIQNINRATAAGMFAGTYHFSRPDILATTVGSNGVPAGVANNGTDEANHFIEMAGPWMRPGYLPPVHDFEAGDGARTDDQMAQFCIDFSNRIYEVMQIRPAIYVNGNYAHNILGGASLSLRNQVVAAYPTLWSARWPNQSDPNSIPVQTGHPKDTYANIYGPWDDSGSTHPWAFWQYASTGRLQSFNSGNSNLDFDVAHGGVEFVKDQLVPAVWMNNQSGDWSTLANWNSGQAPVPPPSRPGQLTPVATGPLPTPRLPGAAGTGPTAGSNDTVILDRPNANITVTHSSGSHTIRKLFVREALNITGGSLTLNYEPHPDSTPISAQFSGSVTLSGTGSFTAHTLQVDASRVFTVNGGSLSLNRLNLMPGTTAAKINVGANGFTFSPRLGASAVIAHGAGTGAGGSVDLTGGTRSFNIANGTAATDLLVSVPVTNGTLTKLGAGTLALQNAGLTGVNVNAGTLEVPTGGAMTVNGAAAANGGIFTVRGTVNARRLTATSPIQINGGRINITPDGSAAGTSRVNEQFSIINGGRLDLNDNDLLVDYDGASPYAQINQWALAGRAGGSGIMSTAALNSGGTTVIAVADNVDLGRTSHDGLFIDTSTIIAKYTYFGDANLDGTVTGDDYVALDSWIGRGSKWVHGDFNGDGIVSGDDYVAVDSNLGAGTEAAPELAALKAEMVALHVDMFGDDYLLKLADFEANGFAAVPEPGSIGLAAIASLTLLRRRR
jgi:GH25 family lysozyme M1 (1,4-beta-N-acetylmuramidase)